ncbi:SDR family NAD(P)-dependent oxidoreductase [Dactylosporangium matsuzakiense]
MVGAGFDRLGPDRFRLDPTDRGQVGRLLDALAADGREITAYAQIVDAGPGNEPATAAAETLWVLAGALVERRLTRPTRIAVVAPEPAAPEQEAIAALAATITGEVPALRVRLVEASGPGLADVLLAELADEAEESWVRYRDGHRQAPGWADVPLPSGAAESFRRGGSYLVSGGAGGIAGLLAEHLVERYGARVMLVGRSTASADLERRMARWCARGGDVRYVRADITDPAQADAAAAATRAAFGRIDGVLHCAGAVRDGVFFRKPVGDLLATCAPKLAGTVNLDLATAGDPLDFFALFSSLSAVLANPGQADYAYANAFQLAYARQRAACADRPGRTLAMAWPLWRDGGMRPSAEAVERSTDRTGMTPLPTRVALELLTQALAGGPSVLAVLHGDPDRVPHLVAKAAEPSPVVVPERETAVAVIGLAGQYPGAEDLDAFWRNLADGRDSIVEVPPERWDHAAYFDPDRSAGGRTYGRWGGFLDGVDRFDFSFFGISRKDAGRMDPQERLFLMASWRALEDAGYASGSLSAQSVGVYVGVMWNHYQLLAEQDGGVAPPAMHASIANRVSYCLDLHGPSMAVDTACSSSLTAVHLAVESIRRGESDLALAGGVNVTIHPQKYLQLAQGQFLSSDGRCRSFGSDGDGYVPGEGVGAVVLKALDRALADGDHIYGVIRATALNHTGRTSGFTVPSPSVQGGLVRAAVAQAGWDPATIGYIEAHGTGTSLGDPIEVEGLRQAFAGAGLPSGSCPIGSVKSNIGHLESAAGIAGLTKVLLQLRHAELVPSLHSSTTNPKIDFTGTPFRVQQTRSAWAKAAGGTPRRAGISAFGAGGANAHLLVEEAPEAAVRTGRPDGACLFVLSARSDAALREHAQQYVDFLADRRPSAGAEARVAVVVAQMLAVPVEAVDHREPLGDLGLDAAGLQELNRHLDGLGLGRAGSGPATLDTTIAELAADGSADDPWLLADLTYSLQVGRTPMSNRLAIVAADVAALRDTLSAFLRCGPSDALWTSAAGGKAGLADSGAALREGRLAEVAAHWVAGGEVRWPTGQARRRPLPTYPFQREVCWLGRRRRTDDPVRIVAGPEEDARIVAPPIPSAVRPELGAGGGEGVEMRVLEPGIALLTMRDDGGRNMFTAAMMEGLESAFARIAADDAIKAVVVTGTETVFSMGATADALETLAGGGSRFTDAPFVYEGMLRCDRPVIAAVRGHASGGGLAFGLYADMVVMAREGVYSANFMKYGFTPGMGATYILEQRLGPVVAAEMFFTGRPLEGAELERRGANVSFAAQADVLAVALGLARSAAEKAPHAVRVLKRDLADRALERLRPVIVRESAMHDQVFGADSVSRIQEHFAKVNGFRAEPAPTPVATLAPRTTPTPAPAPAPAPVPAQVPQPAAEAPPAGPDSATVAAVVQDVLCASLYLEKSEIDPKLNFNEMGLDSLGAVELVREVNRAFGLDIDSVAVYDHPTIPQMVAHIGELLERDRNLRAAATAAAPRAVPPAPRDAAPVSLVSLRPVSEAPPAAPPPAVTLQPTAPTQAPAVTLQPTAPTPAPPVVEAPTVAAAPSPSPGTGPEMDDRAVPIAVIGMSGRFPDASDLDTLWHNLVTGRDSVREVPAGRWDVATYFDPDRRTPGRTYSKWAALLDDVDLFDPQFFRISPLEAAAMDPQQRLFLQTAWSCVEDAGYALTGGAKRRWGVFVGCAAGDYLDLLRPEQQSETAHAFLGNSSSVLAARIAYLLDLTGPTMAVDTACSSSLVAVHLACESIRSGECDAALAGGVALMLTPRMHVLTSKTGMLSPTGRSAPFDASADGIVLGEGSGAVLLKRLDRALADGDRVHGVILGSGVNGDGRTNGITAPSALSQADLIRRVQQRAGVVPTELSYVEAHGTGTPLGDPIEVRALDMVLGTDGDSCGIGSVKSNIGHTTMAAGVAGLLKVLLALRHRTLPPSLHYATANPEIDRQATQASSVGTRSAGFGRGRLRPIAAAEPWRPGSSGRLVGAVSSFGFSGTNAHLIVAEPPAPIRPAGAHEGPWLVPVSALDRPALVRSLNILADRLERHDSLADTAFTLALGRAHLPARAAFVVTDLPSLVPLLRSEAAGRPQPRGDGELHESAAAFVRGEDIDWHALYADSGGRRTSLPTYPFARERHWIDAGPATPAVSATPATPAVPMEPAASVQPTTPVEPGIGPVDWIVADHVIGGTPLLPGVASFELVAAASARPADSLRLTSVQWLRPFEVTQHREPAVVMNGDTFELSAQPGGPACTRGRVAPADAAPVAELLDPAAIAARCANIRTRADIYPAFAAAGIAYGPSFQALDLVRYGENEALGTITVPPARALELGTRPLHPVPLDAALQVIMVLTADEGRAQVPFALAALDVFGPVPAHGYAHVIRDGAAYTVRLADLDGRVLVRLTGLALRPVREPEPPIGLYVPSWADAAPLPTGPVTTGGALVIHGPEQPDLAEAIAAAHRAGGAAASTVAWPDAPLAMATAPDEVYFLAGRRAAGSEKALFRVVKALLANEFARRPLRLKVVLSGAVDVDGGPVTPSGAGTQGMAATIAAEYPQWTVGCIDIGSHSAAVAGIAERLRHERCTERLVAWRAGRRLVRALIPADMAPVPGRSTPAGFRAGGTYLIVGGAGGIGQALCRHLARTAGANLVIIGRSEAGGRIAALLADIEQLGGQGLYLSADTSDPQALRLAVRQARRRFGAVHGAFHAALVLRDRTLARMDESDLDAVLAPKVAGAVTFGETLRTERLDFLTFFSSAVSFTAAAGQANYAAASTFEDAYAMQLRRRCAFPVSVVNWGYWGSVGVVADERHAQRLAGFGVRSIDPSEGMTALTALLASGLPKALVIKANDEGLARLGVRPPAPSEQTGTTDPIARARAAFAELERLSVALVTRRLEEAGAVPATATSGEVLATRLHALPERRGLVDAVAEMLADSGTGPDAPVTADALLARYPDLAPHVELLTRSVEALPDVLNGSRGATEVLFPGGSADLVERVYRGQRSADHYHRLLAEQVAAAAARVHRELGRPARILEIGAGTGSSTAFVLPAVDGTPVDYCYTDVSTAFLRRGEDAFGQRYPSVRFQRLDIEQDPAPQGFAEHGYDIVVATNVLHATARMATTLGNARRLLTPGGLLLVNEVTRSSHFLTLTFGLTPGWWRFQDPAVRLRHTPLLGPRQWQRLLAEAGFGGVRTLGFAGTDPDRLEQCLFVATAGTVPSNAAAPAPAAVRDYVRDVFAEVLRFDAGRLEDRVTFENYGVDSLVSLDIVGRLERDLGSLPATLLFEQMTIADLAIYFLEHHADRLAAVLGHPEPAAAAAPRLDEPVRTPAEPPAREQASAPVETQVAEEDIAVVGVAGRYPGAPDVEAFWRLLADGRTGVTEVPAERWDWRTHFDPRKGTAQRTYSRWGGFIDGVDQFDPAFFGILPRDAENIDPQERLFLETAWELLERAGRLGESTREPSTGVFVGTMYGSYGQLAAAGWARGELSGAHSAYWSIANRVSYFLDLHGPSFAVDSACSSSLLAVHLACESIRRGECRTAIAGGVNVLLHPAHFVALSSLNMLSADGSSKVFDAAADGFVPGEGVGAVLLKPLRDAIADGDEIWGVLKGGLANAGGKTGGYTVPNPGAQADLVARAVRRAGVDPATIGYVEAHGTGTELGDPIETAGLSRAFDTDEPGGSRRAIGSVKANIGHLEGAAGIAGLTKVLLQLRHGRLAPCAHLETVNPKIGLDPQRWYFPRELTDWPRIAADVPRRAGVSSFGAGGANVHLVVEEYMGAPVARPQVIGQEHVFVLSARTPGQLRTYAARVAQFLGTPAALDIRLDDLCYTSQVGRRAMAERLAVRVHSRMDLAAKLSAYAAGDEAPGAEVPDGAAANDPVAAWVRGATVDWAARWPAPAPRRIGFPTYPFARSRHWLSTVEETVVRYQRPVWDLSPAAGSSWRPRVLLVSTEDRSLAQELRRIAEAAGTHVEVTAPGDDVSRTVKSLAGHGLLPDAIVHTGSPADPGSSLWPLLELVAGVLRGRSPSPLRVVYAHTGSAPRDVMVAAAIRTLALEHSGVGGARVQFETGAPAGFRAARLFEELTSAATGAVEVRIGDGVRSTKRLEEFTPVAAAAPPVRPDGTYLVTGGAGALGRHIARLLAEAGAGRVVLVGRSRPSRAVADSIAQLGAAVEYRRADIADEAAVRGLVAEIGALRGIVHAAGVTRDALAVRKTAEQVAEVLAPKVTGTVLLDAATAGAPLDFFVLFSSVVAETGNPGQADYAAANAFLNAFAEERESRRARGERRGRTVAIGWPLWADGGMRVDEATRKLFAQRWSMVPMSTAAGLDAFRRGLAGSQTSFLVAQCLPAAVPPDGPALSQARAVPQPDLADAADPERLRAGVEERLRGLASAFLLVDVSEVDLRDDLLETGFDSISLTELITRVNDVYRLDLLPTVLFECANLALFAEYLVREHPAEIAATLPPVASSTPSTPTALSAPAAVTGTPGAPSVTEAGARVMAAGSARGDVAVIGMAGVLPGAADLEAFWAGLAAGADLIGAAPADRLELHAHADTREVRAGFIADVAGFDADLFRISPAEAALMDPQQRLFLQAAWQSVEDAGYRPESLAGTDTGLFVGVSTTDYADLLRAHGVAVQAHTASGIAHSILANRVSHVLDLHGPSEAVDTACSSSLVAIHRAVQSIAAGDCTLALAGGVNALLSPGLFTAFAQSGMLSPDGACKTFDKDADGYVRGEGVGVILLKPLAAAEADGDHVYAVIRGTAVNHGGRSASLTAPNPEAQARVVARAYRSAGIDPATVTAIEAHGTGTRLGDPVEVEGLKKAFAELYGDRGHPAPAAAHVAIGSVKTNIGHLEAASGIAGVLKMLLAMRHRSLPPSIHFAEPNPYLRLDGTPFFVNDRLRPWDGVAGPDGQAVLRAGVSSFGFGGSNAHIVLESAPAAVSGAPVGPQLLVLSARGETALREYAGSLADALGAGLDRVAYTLQVGRTAYPHRLAFVARDAEHAAGVLRALADGETPAEVHRGVAPAGAPARVGGPADAASAPGGSLEAVATRWVDGAAVEFGELWPGAGPGRTPLPGPPLQRRTFWFDDRVDQTSREEAMPQAPEPGRPAAVAVRRGSRVSLAPVSAQRRTAPPAAVRELPPPSDPVPAPARTGAYAVVRDQVADILGMLPEEVAADRPFADLGLDSIFRMDLARRLNTAFSLELQAAELYEYDTVNLLAGHVTVGGSAGQVAAESVERVAVESVERVAVVSVAPVEGVRALVVQLVERVLARPIDETRSFTDNGLTSFDMLRIVSALERRFGAVRKTLLFDRPTVDALTDHLTGEYGPDRSAGLLRASLDEAPDSTAGPVSLVPVAAPSGDGPLIIRKRLLGELPQVSALLDEIDLAHAKEGGLAGRDIAPLAFVGSARRSYFNFSRRDEHLFAWSYAGSEEDFAPLVEEWIAYAARHGLRPNFLSLLPLGEVAGVPLTATPFGAVQRLEDLAAFTLDAAGMSRLRNLVRRFGRSGRCEVVEYRVGDDAGTDREIADMVDRWGAHKQMVNPYVGIVRDELRQGRLAGRHRVFLTRVNGALANVVIITKIPSEPGYLLDLEFYPQEMARGGLEYTIVAILEKLRDEGSELFSFGASFGVRLGTSPTADPDVEAGLTELRSAGIFGEGNFQFKNKFRPRNAAIYLCRPAQGPRTAVTDVILMIANPDIDADVPGMLHGGTPAPRPAAPAAVKAEETAKVPAKAPVKAPATARANAAVRDLAGCGYNPLNLAHADVEIDLLTDSWAELATPAVAARAAHLDDLAARRPDHRSGWTGPSWLPFEHAVLTSSGKAAEALLCRSWAGPRGTVIHNGLFPSWSLSLADAGFAAVRTPNVGDRRPRPTGLFQGDVDLPLLRGRLAEINGGTAFVGVELSGNATGGYPISVANLRAVREMAATHGVPIVLDATRILENAAFVARHEEQWRGADLWDVVRELLSLADAATFSLSKDFGVSFGGLVATRIPALADRLREHEAIRGREVGLAARKTLTAALDDRDGVARQVTERMEAVRALWTGLDAAGVPVVAPAAGHCVLLDLERVERLAGSALPAESCLAWIYGGTGVRAARHLGDLGPDAPSGRHLRLAVPVGLTAAEARDIAGRLAALWSDPSPIPELLPVEGRPGHAGAPLRYHPAAELPEDIEQAMREGHRAADDNVTVLREHAPGVRRLLLGRPDRPVEVLTAGDGPVLLLMHPFNIGAGVFAHQFAGLSDRFRLISVHHPGVGATAAAEDLTLDGLARLYRSVLDELGVTEQVHVLGSSFGGLVAQSYALQYPSGCASLTLVGSSYKVGNRNGEVNRLSVVAAEDFDRIVAHASSARIGRERAGLERLLLRCESMDPEIGLRFLDVFAAQPTLFGRLPDIEVPTLIVQGRHDTVIPAKAAHLLHGAIPIAQYVELAGAGHFPCLTHPDEVADVVLPFLAAHAPLGTSR